jgi:hypothetical protein
MFYEIYVFVDLLSVFTEKSLSVDVVLYVLSMKTYNYHATPSLFFIKNFKMLLLLLLNMEYNETLLQTFKNRALRRIYGPCVDESSGEWRLRTNKELHYRNHSLKNAIMKINRLR